MEEAQSTGKYKHAPNDLSWGPTIQYWTWLFNPSLKRGMLCLTVVASMTGLVIFDPLLHVRGEERADNGNRLLGHDRERSIYGNDESRGSRCFPDPSDVEDPTQTDIRQRCRPNVFLIGVSKCDWMYHHPGMRWVNIKRRKDGELRETAMLEMSKSPMFRWNGMVASPVASETHKVVDYTSHYIMRAEVAFRIAKIYGSASYDGSLKYLVMLRDPVRRAISSWEYKIAISSGIFYANKVMECRKEALARILLNVDQDRTNSDPHLPLDARGLFKLDMNRCNIRYFVTGDLRNAHVTKGLYAVQLQRWMTLFGRENTKVVFLEHIMEDPLGGLESILNFFGLDLLDPDGEKGLRSREEWQRIVNVTHNATSRKAKATLAQQVTPELVQALREFYAPHNRDLESLLGVKLPSSWSY